MKNIALFQCDFKIFISKNSIRLVFRQNVLEIYGSEVCFKNYVFFNLTNISELFDKFVVDHNLKFVDILVDYNNKNIFENICERDNLRFFFIRSKNLFYGIDQLLIFQLRVVFESCNIKIKNILRLDIIDEADKIF